MSYQLSMELSGAALAVYEKLGVVSRNLRSTQDRIHTIEDELSELIQQRERQRLEQAELEGFLNQHAPGWRISEENERVETQWKDIPEPVREEAAEYGVSKAKLLQWWTEPHPNRAARGRSPLTLWSGSNKRLVRRLLSEDFEDDD